MIRHQSRNPLELNHEQGHKRLSKENIHIWQIISDEIMYLVTAMHWHS